METDEYEVSIRCSCGFWRDQIVKRKDDAETIRDEWQNEHFRCGSMSLNIHPVELRESRT